MGGIEITVYGGVAGYKSEKNEPARQPEGEIGGNRILLEWEDRCWLLDFGTRFKRVAKFFEEYLKPRAGILGLRDYLRMALLPPLEGVYRDDLTAHEPDLWERYRGDPHYRRVEALDGVLLSHAHLDHSGCLGFLRPEIPVYTGLVTALIGKGIQDARGGAAGPDLEVSYLAPRQVKGSGVLEGIRGMRVQREHFICETAPAIAEALGRVQAFWCDVPGDRTTLTAAPLELVDPERMDLKFWRVDHSIPGSGAFGVRTPVGWVVYTGDLRRHGHSRWRTDDFTSAAAALKPALLIVEGTRVYAQESIAEPEVQAAADEEVGKSDGLVVADFSARNIERLRTFHDIARARERRLVVTTRDAYLLEQLHQVDPKIPHPGSEGLAILKEPQGKIDSWERGIYDRLASNLIDAAAIRRAPGGYVLCLSFWDISNLIDIDPPGGTYIYSSSEAYTEEQVIDLGRLASWLRHFNLRVVGGLPGAESGPYHASGHIDGPSLEQLIETISPERILPVHTEHLDWFQARWPGKVAVATYGKAVSLG
ncbi:MAG: MBL fold metallo-hydrolase [Gemmatimonadetes bacterium]|nr:MBL fold metallo-hydrolase [Gemmatimonadota bacterium]